MNIAIGIVFGAAWRWCLGHDWGGAPVRVPLMIMGAIVGAGLVLLQGGSYAAVAAAGALTVAYFSLGNGKVLAGPGSPGYIAALVLTYILPAGVAFGILWGLSYPCGIALSGVIGAAGYRVFWRPFAPSDIPWNWYAEALSGAAWFGLLSVALPLPALF